jgi:hypothetical protein
VFDDDVDEDAEMELDLVKQESLTDAIVQDKLTVSHHLEDMSRLIPC